MRTSPLDFRSPSMVVPVPIRLMDALVVSGFLLFIISGVLSGLLLNIVFIFLCSTYVYLPRSNFYILTIKRRRGSYFVRNSFTCGTKIHYSETKKPFFTNKFLPLKIVLVVERKIFFYVFFFEKLNKISCGYGKYLIGAGRQRAENSFILLQCKRIIKR